jgi:DNA-binding NtrC family response regulator
VEVRLPEEVGEALKKPRGVVFIPDVSRLTGSAQSLIVRCLQTQEERPKLVVGLSGAVEHARSKGTLREDLLYRLHRAQVDLTADGMRDVLARHRARLVAEEAARKAEAERVAAEKAAQLKASGISMRSSSRMRSKAAPRATSPKVTRR